MFNFDELDKTVNRYEYLLKELSTPEVAADMNTYRDLSKERKAVEPLVNTYQAYRKCLAEIEEAEKMINGDDDEMKVLAEEELARLKEEKTNLEETIREELIPKDPLDNKNVIMEIRAGTGGDEAALFAGDLMRMYLKYCEWKGFKPEVMSESPAEIGGYKEVILNISGEDVYKYFKFESGAHRVQRVPETETSGRLHTSAATVAVLPEAEEHDVDINESDLKIDTYRSQGAGGQHVNTTDSAVRITHVPTGTIVTCQDEKSQHKNKAKAMKVLRARVLSKLREDEAKELAATRKSMVGSGDRSERIRTYNFPQGRLSDHRINLTLYRLEAVMQGDLSEIIDALHTHEREQFLAQQNG